MSSAWQYGRFTCGVFVLAVNEKGVGCSGATPMHDKVLSVSYNFPPKLIGFWIIIYNILYDYLFLTSNDSQYAAITWVYLLSVG